MVGVWNLRLTDRDWNTDYFPEKRAKKAIVAMKQMQPVNPKTGKMKRTGRKAAIDAPKRSAA